MKLCRMGSVVTVTGFVSRISLFLVFKTKEKYYPNITFFYTRNSPQRATICSCNENAR